MLTNLFRCSGLKSDASCTLACSRQTNKGLFARARGGTFCVGVPRTHLLGFDSHERFISEGFKFLVPICSSWDTILLRRRCCFCLGFRKTF